MKTKDQDHKIMGILKINEISRVICDTNMGTLKLRIRKGETEYKFILDAVELPKELNQELMEAIYPKVVEQSILPTYVKAIAGEQFVKNDLVILKPKGRPKGAKNKVKKATDGALM